MVSFLHKLARTSQNIKNMKKLTFICLLLAVSCIGSRLYAQWYFYEDFNTITIDANGAGNIPNTFTLYNDKNTPNEASPDYSYFDKAWKVLRDIDGNGKAASISFFKKDAIANRWMITPSISLQTASTPQLHFRVMAGHATIRDGISVRLSTTTNDSLAFTTVLKTIREAKENWTDYVIDLSEYKNQSVYIAFIQNSVNKYIVYVDDIRVAEKSSSIAASCSDAYVPMYMVFSDTKPLTYPITATIQNWSDNTLNSFRFCYRVNGGSVVSKLFEGKSIQSMKSETVSLDFKPQSYGGNQEFEIWFENMNGTSSKTETSKRTSFVEGDAELPYKKLMLEGFSSAMCVNCGPQNGVLHRMTQKLNGNAPSALDGFVLCKYQVDIPSAGDPTVTPETLKRSYFYGINGAPTWIVNGKPFQLGSEEEETARFIDSINSFRQTFVPLALSIDVKKQDSTFTIDTKIEGKLPCIGEYVLHVNILEDSIRQNVVLMSGEKDFFYIVRKMLPNENGTVIDVPAVGDVYTKKLTYSFTQNSPTIFSSLEGVSVVAFLQNTKTKEVIQAAFAFPDFGWTNKDGRNEAVSGLKIYPNPTRGQSTISFSTTSEESIKISILDQQGKVMQSLQRNSSVGKNTINLPTENLSAGQYIIRVENRIGSSFQKLLKN